MLLAVDDVGSAANAASAPDRAGPFPQARVSPALIRASAMLMMVAAPYQVGCAHGNSNTEPGGGDRQVAALRDEIRRVQADHDKMDQRLSSLELQAADDRRERASEATAQEPWRPRVVLLRPGSTPDGAGARAKEATDHPAPPAGASAAPEGASTSTDDHTPRPTIRVVGARGRAGDGKRRAGDGTERIEETLPEEQASVAGVGEGREGNGRPSALDPQAKRDYDAALALVNAHKYDRALEALAGFLVRYPDHPNADNALYWRGECYFAENDFTRAAEQFEAAVSRFPMGNKVPDALLKLGMCQTKLGLSSKAKPTFERLAREYPRSEAARRLPREETP